MSRTDRHERPVKTPAPMTWASKAAQAGLLDQNASHLTTLQAKKIPSSTDSKTSGQSTAPIAPPSNHTRMLRNSYGQRIDPLVTHNKEEVARLKKLKLCNAHFLRRFCRSGSDCYHNHTYKIAPEELKTLGHVARMAPCGQGSECDDEDCYHGHVCPAPKGRNGELCIFGEMCRFPDEMHNVERK